MKEIFFRPIQYQASIIDIRKRSSKFDSLCTLYEILIFRNSIEIQNRKQRFIIFVSREESVRILSITGLLLRILNSGI